MAMLGINFEYCCYEFEIMPPSPHDPDQTMYVCMPVDMS